MNVFLIHDPENENWLTVKRDKWSPLMSMARLFVNINEAQKVRSSIKKRTQKKYQIYEFELREIGTR